MKKKRKRPAARGRRAWRSRPTEAERRRRRLLQSSVLFFWMVSPFSSELCKLIRCVHRRETQDSSLSSAKRKRGKEERAETVQKERETTHHLRCCKIQKKKKKRRKMTLRRPPFSFFRHFLQNSLSKKKATQGDDARAQHSATLSVLQKHPLLFPKKRERSKL